MNIIRDWTYTSAVCSLQVLHDLSYYLQGRISPYLPFCRRPPLQLIFLYHFCNCRQVSIYSAIAGSISDVWANKWHCTSNQSIYQSTPVKQDQFQNLTIEGFFWLVSPNKFRFYHFRGNLCGISRVQTLSSTRWVCEFA